MSIVTPYIYIYIFDMSKMRVFNEIEKKLESQESYVSPGKTEVKHSKFVEFISFREKL